MNKKIAKLAQQLGHISQIWDTLVPEEIKVHTALESLQRGILTVMVDSASHRFQLQMLLKSGLLNQIRSEFKGALNKIRLVPGQFSTTDPERGNQKYEL